MDIRPNLLTPGEQAMLSLRGLYRQYGYSPFKMSKFEEYDFYAQSKNFLSDGAVIPFSSAGKLMALRPDVTLSIVKNVKGTPPQPVKVYYNENVYRAAGAEQEVREIMQSGLECIGSLDLYQMSEVILLAAQSLATIGGSFLLDLSHMGFLQALLDEVGVADELRPQILRCISEKNAHELLALCSDARLAEAATLYGTPEEILPRLRSLCSGEAASAALDELDAICTILSGAGYGENIHIDLSIVHDMDYYNGVIFSGYLAGIPQTVLSGGRYDRLLARMGKSGSAIGFAVYLNLLEQRTETAEYDADILLLYDEEVDPAKLLETAQNLSANGQSVRVQNSVPTGFRCRQILRMSGKGGDSLAICH